MCLSQVFQLVGKVQLVSRHSSVADRLPVVRFPAGPRVRLKTADLPPVLLSFFPSTFAAVFAALQEALPLSCCSTCEMVAIVRISLQFLRIKPRFFVRKGSRSKQFFLVFDDLRGTGFNTSGQLLRLVLIPCHIKGEPHHWTRSTAISFAAELDGHVLGTLCAVTMALLTNRLDLCIQGLFGAGKSKSMAVLILALLELDVTDSLKILFICKENSGTRSFADLLLWLDPPSGVLGRIGRLVRDRERNKSSYSHTKFDINPRERRQMLNRCQLVMATGGTIAQDLTMQWSTLGGFMQDLSLLVIDEGQQYGTDREIAVISLLKQQPLVIWTGDSQQTPGGIAQAAPNAKRSRQLLLTRVTQ